MPGLRRPPTGLKLGLLLVSGRHGQGVATAYGSSQQSIPGPLVWRQLRLVGQLLHWLVRYGFRLLLTVPVSPQWFVGRALIQVLQVLLAVRAK